MISNMFFLKLPESYCFGIFCIHVNRNSDKAVKNAVERNSMEARLNGRHGGFKLLQTQHPCCACL